MNKVRFFITKLVPVYIKILAVEFLSLFGYGKEFKETWIISERGTDARDNGYFFFKYMRENHPEIDCCYVITPFSPDFSKVALLGKTVVYGSLRHYAAVIRSKCLISSHIMGFTPFPEAFSVFQKNKIFKLPGKQIFLQHGITKGDIKGLKFPNIQVDRFICGAYAEYEYIKNTYNHPKGVVCFTGLARYDTLNNDGVKPQILLMPTWRKWLNSLSDKQFCESEYYMRYHRLLSNPNIIEWLNDNGLKIMFYPHYEMQKYLHLFEDVRCDCIQICAFEDFDVQALLNTSALLITDYSSVYFDFAYLHKPIIYYQFDREDFFNNHYNKGYFDEEIFGPVAKDVSSLEKTLVSSYDGTVFKNLYADRQKEFFGDLNPNCCDRIYNAIQELL